MKTHTLVGAGLTALLLAGFAAGGVTLAGGRDVGKQAVQTAGKASKALVKGDAAHAVSFAEAAVALKPQDSGYRMLLGQSYLKAGRFQSAHQAFADVLALEPGNAKAALNLALCQIAEGQWDAARQTLTTHADVIPARDRGLAWALAGDPVGGAEILMAAARTPDADAKIRQNLGLALALSGRWSDAKAVIATDLSPADTSKRIIQWLNFARPTSASDQVATLLGVKAAQDAGQPVALALNASAAAPVTEVAEAVPAAEAAPVEVASAPVAVEVPAAEAPADTTAKIVFADRHEVVQAVPASAPRKPVALIAAKGAFKTKLAAAPVAAKAVEPAKGQWFVQLGAFDSAGVARDAWARATRRYAALSSHTPAGMAFKAQHGQFYRLSVGGFARTDAVAMCRAYRAKGGACFVRMGAGDQIAQWIKPAKVQTAKAQPKATAAPVQTAAKPAGGVRIAAR